MMILGKILNSTEKRNLASTLWTQPWFSWSTKKIDLGN